MTESYLTQYIAPLVLAFIMFGMGLSLTRNDFQQLWRAPLPIVVGLFGQMMLLPALAYALAIVFDLAPNLAIGIMILAACPGGTSSNIISQLARRTIFLSSYHHPRANIYYLNTCDHRYYYSSLFC